MLVKILDTYSSHLSLLRAKSNMSTRALKITTIIGARPQFIKAAPVSRAIAEHNSLAEVIIHTGQHFDADMSDVFFKELNIPKPDYNLGINSASHGAMTGRMLEKIEEILIKEKPDWVLVYGDTNSTLAGALVAAKLHIPAAHVEAGLRSFNREMPEEINRVLTDHISTVLFCPTQTAVNNLYMEGIKGEDKTAPCVVLVGDVMYDSVLYNLKLSEKHSDIIKNFKLIPKKYALATVHRAENTDNPKRLKAIFDAFEQIVADGLQIIIPIHPRTKQSLINSKSKPKTQNLKVIPPVGYLDMLLLEKNAFIILTDSGGIQKEAYWHNVPCITLRDETEWVETVEAGWNMVVGADRKKIVEAVKSFKTDKPHHELYGDGRAAEKIVEVLCDNVLCSGMKL